MEVGGAFLSGEATDSVAEASPDDPSPSLADEEPTDGMMLKLSLWKMFFLKNLTMRQSINHPFWSAVSFYGQRGLGQTLVFEVAHHLALDKEGSNRIENLERGISHQCGSLINE